MGPYFSINFDDSNFQRLQNGSGTQFKFKLDGPLLFSEFIFQRQCRHSSSNDAKDPAALRIEKHSPLLLF